ncbi:MAG: histidinol dehydrogenase [Acidimicrobiales bacterium]|nr:histidinol dehydrogenase [Acidimicrobiales bacterium]
MLRRLDLRGVAHGPGALASVLPRPASEAELPVAAVREILSDVKAGGDAALRRHTLRLDGVSLEQLRLPAAATEQALEQVPAGLRRSLEVAGAAIADYHRHDLVAVGPYQRDGLRVRELIRPVERAGCYVPGGKARYPSTVLMTAIPAKVAGVPEVALCVPPRPDGTVDPVTLAAAAIAGVDEVYPLGGAQAIGALAYGTESVPRVDVVVGPGNLYVSVAKQEVAGVVGVPSAFAGPSEVVVVADRAVKADLAAVDLVVQAEHGPFGLAWLVAWDEDVVDAVCESVARLVPASPRRSELESTLARGGYAVLVDGPEQAMSVANAIAPEHLELLCDDPEALLPLVRSAGAVFCGPFAPASVGDYVAGPSHVLPTFGSARFANALRVDDFLRRIHVIDVDEEALLELGPHVVALAEAEGLAAHAESVRLRGAG